MDEGNQSNNISKKETGESIKPFQKGNKRTVILIVIVSLMIAALCGIIGYYAGYNTQKTKHISMPPKKKTTPNSGWKTYISPDHTYTFSYPSTWTLLPVNNGVVVHCYPDYSSLCNSKGQISDFNTKIDKPALSFSQFTKTATQGSVNLSTSTENTTLDGQPAIVEIVYGIAPQAVGSSGSSGIYYYVIYHNVGYEVNLSLNSPLAKKYTINQLLPLKPDILSSFKFL